MKKIILTLGILLGLATSCQQSKHSVLKDVFMDYVQTDFGDPEEFEQITSIEPYDTLTHKMPLDALKKCEIVYEYLSDDLKKEMDSCKERLEKDKTNIVTYKVKVRIERFGRKSIQEYFILDDGLNYKVQDHEMRAAEAPQVYKDFFGFLPRMKRELGME